jgi:hypothetical protein
MVIAASHWSGFPPGEADSRPSALPGVAGFSSFGPASVTATSTRTVFVGLSGEGGTAGDARSGQLRLRLHLREAFAMPNTDLDGLHRGLLTTDENGQRPLAVTTSGLSIVQLANVPLAIGTLSPSARSAAGGSVVILRGGGFQNGITATMGGKSASVFPHGHEYTLSGATAARTDKPRRCNRFARRRFTAQ